MNFKAAHIDVGVIAARWLAYSHGPGMWSLVTTSELHVNSAWPQEAESGFEVTVIRGASES